MQETFLRAWRARASFSSDGRSSFRAWLYRIATNACLDALARKPRRVLASQLGPAGGPGRSRRRPRQIFPGCSRIRTTCWRESRRATTSRTPWSSPGRRSRSRSSPRSAAAAAPAGRADHARRARLVGEGNRGAVRGERPLGQQRAAAGTCDAAGASARAPRWSGRPLRIRAGRSAPCCSASWMPSSAAISPPWPSCCTRTCARTCLRSPSGSRGARRTSPAMARGFDPALAGLPRRLACRCRPAPTCSRRPPSTSGRPASPSTARSRSTCCASRTGKVVEITAFIPDRFDPFAAFGLPPTL